MAEQKIKMALPGGKIVDGIQVDVMESTERWSDFTLADGTKIRAKVTLIQAQRAINEYDPNGQPWYLINVQPVMSIAEIPESLKNKAK